MAGVDIPTLWIKTVTTSLNYLNSSFNKGVHENIITSGDQLVIHRRPTCLIGDPLETNIPVGPFGDRHACGVQLEFKHIYLNILIFIYCMLISI